MMRRILPLLIALLVMAGCSKEAPPAPPTSEEKPDQASTTIKPGRTDWPAGLPVQEFQALQRTKKGVPITTNACPTDGAPLQLDIQSAGWERYPNSSEPYWIPSFTVAACTHNPKGESVTPTLSLEGSLAFEGRITTDTVSLSGGDGWGPVKFTLEKGLPDRFVRLMRAGLMPWPKLNVVAETGTARTTHELPPLDGSASTAAAFLPTQPSAEVLAEAAWGGAQRLGEDQYYLYAPDMRFDFNDFVSCGRKVMNFGASANAWRLYRLSPGGKPTLVGQIGAFTFQAGKGWSWEERPKTGYAFLRLDIYGNCHVPDGSLLWALDRQSGELHRPQLITPEGRSDAYTYESLDELGGFRLDRGFYAMEGPVPEPLPFRWNPADGNWYAEGMSPQGGPGGAPESPARVYSTKP